MRFSRVIYVPALVVPQNVRMFFRSFILMNQKFSSQHNSACEHKYMLLRQDADCAANPSPDCVSPWTFLTIASYSGPIKVLSRATHDKCTYVCVCDMFNVHLASPHRRPLQSKTCTYPGQKRRPTKCDGIS